MITLKYAAAVALLLAFGATAATAATASIVRDDDVIDVANPCSGERIEVENGLSGPTTYLDC